MTIKSLIQIILILILLTGCATYKAQYKEQVPFAEYPAENEIEKTFYLTGDAGYSELGSTSLGLIGFKQAIDTVREGDYAIFLGDNIYPKGLPKKDDPKRQLSEHRLNTQLHAVSDFKGQVLFLPGNHDWYDEGLQGLKRQEEYLEGKLEGQNIFKPEDACPLDEIEISESIHLIIVDSQWYLENWDKNPGINDNCEIKSREKFLLEFESMIKKNEGKTIIVAIHHPLFTYGPHGGYFSARQQLYPSQRKIPVPILGMLANHIRQSGGVSKQDLQNERYNELATWLQAIIKYKDEKVIVVSGHEHSLQYIISNDIPQIIAGSGSKASAARLTGDAVFVHGKQGLAILDVFKDGSSWIRYYVNNHGKNELVYQTEIYPPKKASLHREFPETYPEYVKTAVYSKAETEKTDFYESFWGDHYREIYGTEIKAKVALLDTLYGGLKPVRMGGGHQTKTLRLVGKNGREYNMRAIKKSAVQFLQTVALKGKVLDNEDLTETLPEKILLDFYTASHPYTPYVVGVLSDAVNIYHTNPKVYYIPKQQALGDYNLEYGDELYMIEERPAKEHRKEPSFGLPDDIESTDAFFSNLRDDEKYKLDESAYIRARMFDMLIGDWDRHEDQWRWAEFDTENGKIYRPIPRDRDQAFSHYDGAILGSLRTLISPAKMIQPYKSELKNLEYFNAAALPMDRILLQNATKEDWIREAKYIQEHLTDDIIEKAFTAIPAEINTATTDTIKMNLKGRRALLNTIAGDYYKIVNKIAILKGTDKDDIIEVTRSASKETNVKIYRNKRGEKIDLMVNKTFHADVTKEIWVYGLDDDDIFEVKEKVKNPIRIRLIGGQNNDIYRIQEGGKVIIYDHKSKENTVEFNNGAREKFTDIYNNNIFTFERDISKTRTFLPNIGYNPDDGVKIGLRYEERNYKFESDPFTTWNAFTANYFFATKGFEFMYDGELTNVFGKINLTYGAKVTSANFTRNFFGVGNETDNFDDELGMNYNRVKTSILTGYLGLIRRSNYGSRFSGTLRFEGIQLDNTEDRFITDIIADETFFDRKYFTTAEIGYTYQSYDEPLNPTRGMKFHVNTGYTHNFSNTNNNFGYLNSHLGFHNRLSKNRKLVLKTNVATQIRFGEDFEFYQGAQLGGKSGLRGYRLERFTGKNSLVFNGDVRYNFNSFKTSFLPMQIGIYGGYDYGRVWVPNESSNTWHDSVGGGIYVIASQVLSADFSFFNSDNGSRFAFQLGLSF